MDIKILTELQNPLLNRKEITFEVNHNKEGKTCSRKQLRDSIAKILKTQSELVYIQKIKTRTGEMIAIGKATAYESQQQAELVESKHILIRHSPPKKEAEERGIQTEATQSEESTQLREEQTSTKMESNQEKKPTEGSEEENSKDSGV